MEILVFAIIMLVGISSLFLIMFGKYLSKRARLKRAFERAARLEKDL